MLALARLAGNEENFSFMIAALFELGWAGLRSWSWSCKCLSLVIHHFQLLSFRFTIGQKVGSKILLDSLCMVASVIFEDAKIDINTAV